MESFIVVKELATTAYSKILKCKNKKTKEIVVLKILHEKKTEESPSKVVLREITSLYNLKHPNILKMNNFFVHKINVVLELEYCPATLSSIISNISKPLYESQIKKIIKSIAEGLKYIHQNDIIQRDLKPSNIFIDENSNVKIGDFGSSRILPENINNNLTPLVGTKWYKAPEMLFGTKNYDKSVDIWSFGCIMAEMFLLEPIFPGNTDFEMINYIFDFLGYTKEDNDVLQPKFELNFKNSEANIFEIKLDNADNLSIDLIKNTLVVNPRNRLTIEKILEHPYLAEEKNYMEAILPII